MNLALNIRPRGFHAGRMGAQYVSLGVAILVVFALSAFLSRFNSADNLGNIVIQFTPLLIVAIGQTMVVLTNGLDISIGSMMSLSTAIIALTPSPFVGIVILAAVAAAVGLANGIGVTLLRVHPIIMTLATSTLLQGVVLAILPSPGGQVPHWLVASASTKIHGVPEALIWVLAVILVGTLILHRSRLGLHILAVGGAEGNARLAGVATSRTVMYAYMLSAALSAVAGLFLAGRISSGDPWVGANFSLDSVAAVALGGTQLTGGIGGILGAVSGSFLLNLVGNALNLGNVSPFLQEIVNGLLLLVAVSLRPRAVVGL